MTLARPRAFPRCLPCDASDVPDVLRLEAVIFARQRREVAALAQRVERARARSDAATARLDRAKARFLANPFNLLLPFTTGALSAALALYRQPKAARAGRRQRERVSLTSLLTTATTVWGATLPIREALREAREAQSGDAEAPTGELPSEPAGPPRTEPPPTPRVAPRPPAVRDLPPA